MGAEKKFGVKILSTGSIFVVTEHDGSMRSYFEKHSDEFVILDNLKDADSENKDSVVV